MHLGELPLKDPTCTSRKYFTGILLQEPHCTGVFTVSLTSALLPWDAKAAGVIDANCTATGLALESSWNSGITTASASACG